jgi:undecaprenyl-diphosphatase
VIDAWQAVCLALVQGVTEFLPISSSAHLLLPSLLLGWPDQGLAFDVAVHVGTLLAVLWYFRTQLLALAHGVLRAVVEGHGNDHSREVLYLALASLPVALVGLLLNARMEALRTMPVVISTTIVFALLLAVADRRADRAGRLEAVPGAAAAVLIGLAQALAPIPGTSRSGITISAGLLLGLTRQAASRFAFLLSIPVIAGAGLLKGLELAGDAGPGVVDWPLLLGATGVAALSAYLCIALFLALIERIGMLPFVVYRLLLGGVLLALWWR